MSESEVKFPLLWIKINLEKPQYKVKGSWIETRLTFVIEFGIQLRLESRGRQSERKIRLSVWDDKNPIPNFFYHQ